MRKHADAHAIIEVRQELMADSRLSSNFMTLVVTSCLIATLGLLTNSAAVIIGAMLVAPLMLPLRGLAFGALAGDTVLFRRSIVTLVAATLVALAISTGLGKFVGLQNFGSEVIARTEPTLADLAIAVVAGGLSGFSKIRPGINDAVAGTAIAVALMPPLCVVGLTLSQNFFDESYGALLLYWTNLLGITLACMIVFVVAGYVRANRALGWASLLTGVLVIPLGISLIQLLYQANLESTLKRIFQEETYTGRRVELLGTDILWTDDPIEVYLRVRADEPITPKQVRLVQTFLSEELERELKLVFLVEPITEVRAGQDPPKFSEPVQVE